MCVCMGVCELCETVIVYVKLVRISSVLNRPHSKLRVCVCVCELCVTGIVCV